MFLLVILFLIVIIVPLVIKRQRELLKEIETQEGIIFSLATEDLKNIARAKLEKLKREYRKAGGKL